LTPACRCVGSVSAACRTRGRVGRVGVSSPVGGTHQTDTLNSNGETSRRVGSALVPIDPLSHAPLVALAVQRWGWGLDRADATQTAWLALLVACQAYDASRGRWPGYALTGMRRALLRAARGQGVVRGPLRRPDLDPVVMGGDALDGM